MPFGRHTVTNVEQVIELNDNEIKDLENAGPKHWFSVKPLGAQKPVKKVTKKATKKATKKVSKRLSDG